MNVVLFNNKDINTMGTVELLQALQTTDKYYELTQKQIVNNLGSSSVYILRKELKTIKNNITFNSLPIELQSKITKKLPLSTSTIINKNLYNANQIKRCEKFKIPQSILKNYQSNDAYVLLKSQQPATGDIYNAYINKNIGKHAKMLSVSFIKAEMDYIVIAALDQKDEQTSEYSQIFYDYQDKYKIKYTVDLYSVKDHKCNDIIKDFTKKQSIKILDKCYNDINYYYPKIAKLKNYTEFDDQIGSVYRLLQNYVYLFSSALIADLVKYEDFMKPFGEKYQYMISNDIDWFGNNIQNNFINNQNIIKNIYNIMLDIYNILVSDIKTNY
jgi:hypothetical protein